MIKYLIEKEFKQFIRNRFLPRLVILMPCVMLLILPWAANQEIKNINLGVIDNDHSVYSQRLIQKAAASNYFNFVDYSPSYPRAMEAIQSGDIDIIMEIPAKFEKDLLMNKNSQVLISANAVNGTKGAIGSNYLASIIMSFSQEVKSEQVGNTNNNQYAISLIKTHELNKFNPHMDYKVFMVPALMVMLMTLICGFLPALNIVGEKEAGTIEQINVTPIPKFTFVIAKLIPYWIIGFIVLTLCFGIAYFVYGLVPVGNLLTIYVCALIYILAVSGFGLVISNYSNTMQQAMFVIFFFMLIFILLSGLFTPVNSMPEWAQAITAINPLKYFILIMRQVYLKGSGLIELIPQIGALGIFAVISNVWAIVSYRKIEN
ncbi:ABC transporter permease [Bacteroidales bacterium OttesenSCG-928-M06]|nr:ABC transporter permease [Bacteroidales bacterium OttesenSCG-928-M06]